MECFHAGAPMERVHLDFLGPLPTSTRGNQYLLMMVDQFTKWIECVPLPSQTAEVTARAAVDHFFSRFGCPLQVHTDQGRNFESSLFQEICKLLQITKTRTTSYRPSSNGQVERYNRTLLQMIRCHLGKLQSRWDEFLPQLTGAIRSSVNRQTGYTANKLMLGREVNMPADLVFGGLGPVSDEVDEHEYLRDLRAAITESHLLARSKLRTALKVMKREYDLRARSSKFQEGDAVYLLDSASAIGRCKKLCPIWKGPWLVIKKWSPNRFTIQDPRRTLVIHHDKIKLWTDRRLPLWLLRKKKMLSNSQVTPRSVTHRDSPQTESPDSEVPLYCLCREPDDGSLMIICDSCEEWLTSLPRILTSIGAQIAPWVSPRLLGLSLSDVQTVIYQILSLSYIQTVIYQTLSLYDIQNVIYFVNK